MPVQTPQWCDLLCCCICYNVFDGVRYQPVSLVCGHTACRSCLLKLKTKQCPFDQSAINIPIADLPQNMPILKILDSHQLVVAAEAERLNKLFEENDLKEYRTAASILDILASYLRRAQSEKGGSVWSPQLSRPMQRKLVMLLCCQLAEPEGRGRALKSIRSLGERSLMELLLLHQNPYHLSSNLWAAVRGRGCQFLGPAMQEEVLKLVLLALSEGALISRKVLVMYIVQTLEKDYPQASKTSVGHVVQLLYRASCFNVIKRDGESSLMQLKEEFRCYDALRREHDAQIVQIAMEAGLRISPDQWSALLYGDQAHKSHMQSIIDRLQTPQSFVQSIQELMIGLQRTGDPASLVELRPYYELLADIDAAQGETVVPSWGAVVDALVAVKAVIEGQVRFCERYGGNRNQRENIERSVVAYKFKTSMCRDIGESKMCVRGESCTFAHSLEEMERYRARSRLMGYRSNIGKNRSGGATDGASVAPTDGCHSDNDFDFGFDDSDKIDGSDRKHRDASAIGGILAPQQLSAVRQSPVLLPGPGRPPQSAPVPAFPPPAAFQAPVDDATAAASVVVNTSPLQYLGPGATNVMMQWPPNAAIVNTPGGPVAVGTAQPGSFPMGTGVRYQVFRHRGATCSPGPPSQSLQPTVHVAAAAPEYGYYWYPPAANIQPRANVYQPGDVVHVEMPLARVLPTPQPAVPGNLTTAGGGIATAVAGAHYAAVSAFPELPSAPNNPAAQTASVTPFGSYAFAQADSGAVYFYPPPQEQHAGHAGGQFGIYIAPTVDDLFLYNQATLPAATNGMDGGGNDIFNEHYDSQQQAKQSAFNNSSMPGAICVQTDGVSCATASSAANTNLVVSSSSNKTTLSSCVSSTINFKTSTGAIYPRNKEEEKQTRLVQLEMKKDEIIKRLTSFKKETYPTCRQSQRDREEHMSYARFPRSSSDSDQADTLSTSIATSVLQDDYPAVNYAAAVLRGRQGTTSSSPQSPGTVGAVYSNGALDSGCWTSLGSTVSMSASSGGFPQSSIAALGNSRRSISADGTSTDYYSQWKISAASGGGTWAQTKTTQSSNGAAAIKTVASHEQYYNTRPYIPDEHIDIKHLSDDVLRKELEQLPPHSKRLHYIRRELEAREADAWRSEDDQVIPFSTCGPQVSRYGPISRAGQRMQSSVMTSSSLSAAGTAPSDSVVQVKDILLQQPLPTASVQPTKGDQPVVSRNDVDPSHIVSSIPQVFKASQMIDPSTVDEKLEKLVEVKSKLASIPLEDGGGSSAEKEQLKVELELIDKEISLLDDRAGEECLLKALENVNLTIEELQQPQQKRQINA